jgi:hypothetical protein
MNPNDPASLASMPGATARRGIQTGAFVAKTGRTRDPQESAQSAESSIVRMRSLAPWRSG